MEKEELKIEDLADTVAMMSVALQTMNSVLMCLLHNLDTNTALPIYQTKETFEKDMSAKIGACEEAIRKIYGPRETDKS